MHLSRLVFFSIRQRPSMLKAVACTLMTNHGALSHVQEGDQLSGRVFPQRAFSQAAALEAADLSPVTGVADSPTSEVEAKGAKKQGFRKFKLVEMVVRSAEALGLVEPTAVQKRVIPLVLKGQSAFISAETGSGKTAAYCLPLLELARQQVAREEEAHQEDSESGVTLVRAQRPLCLVLTPTADLASQVYGHCEQLGRSLPDVRVSLLTGASSVEPANQVKALLHKDAEILVATPGRLLRLLQMAQESSDGQRAGEDGSAGRLSLAGVRQWVVDECDRVARMGLMQDVKQLFPFLPRPPTDPADKPMQVLLVSATVTPAAEFLLKRFAPSAASINLNPSFQVAATIKHVAYTVTSKRKAALLEYLLKRKGSFRGSSALVFVRTRQRAVRLAGVLASRGISAEALHADLTATQRWKILEGFKGGVFQCLVATDVLGRGIDIPHLPVLVNFDLPLSPEDYVHQVGRTGRAGRAGLAVSLVSKDTQQVPIGGPHQRALLQEEDFLEQVEKLIGGRVERRKVPGPWKDVDWHQLDDALAGTAPEKEFERQGVKRAVEPDGWQGRGRKGIKERETERQKVAGQARSGRGEASSTGNENWSKGAVQSRSRGVEVGARKPGCTNGEGGSEGPSEEPRKVQDIVEGMEKGLAQRAGIKRLSDVEEKAPGKRRRRMKNPAMLALQDG